MRAKLLGFFALAAFIAWPAVSPAQFPGMGGGGGFDISKLDPNFLFNMLGKGKDSVSRDELDERSQRMFDRFAPMMGITGNTITRDQFSQGFAKVSEMAKNGQIPGVPAPGGTPGGPPGVPGGRGPGGDTDRIAESAFNRYDKNMDGLIQIDELPEDHALRNEREKYDTSRDGAYDLTEFKVYVTARLANPGGNDPRNTQPQPGTDNPDRRPTVTRASNLPKDLPPWFAELDRNGDRDGQVGLYEWKEGGKKISEYVPMDLNSDGYLTVDEYYRWKKKSDDEARKNGDSAGDQYARGGAGGAGGERGGRGGFPGGGRGGFPGMGEQAAPGGGFPGMGMRGPGGEDRSKGNEERSKGEERGAKKEEKREERRGPGGMLGGMRPGGGRPGGGR